jgi:hypothetical protein
VSDNMNNTVLSSLLRIITSVIMMLAVWQLFKLLIGTNKSPDYKAHNEGDNGNRKVIKCKVLE